VGAVADHRRRSDERVRHWDRVYTDKATTDLSWYQPEPAVSLDVIESLGIAPDSGGIVDIGGGSSLLVDRLLARGHRDLTVLDLSEVALRTARGRVGSDSPVTWLARDVLRWVPDRTFALWHDRAVLHFLAGHEVDEYRTVLSRALPVGGAFVAATFAPEGPERCSGLPVTRYSAEDLGKMLGPGFDVVYQRREVHLTPGGAEQPFTWVAARRTTG
jgi:hypothetical protein